MSLSFLEVAERALHETKQPMTATEMWAHAEKKKWKTDSVGKTPEASISAQIYLSLKNNPRSPFQKVSKHPTRFALTGWGDMIRTQILKLESYALEDENSPLNERSLHPHLAKFVYSNSHFNAYVKTIHHEISSRSPKGANRWLHPDLVGVHFTFEDYETETQIIQSLTKAPLCKFYSFEMKIRLEYSNLREAFFQAVSNSSWANEGYLVATKINQEIDFKDELARLNKAFGIGIILLDTKNPEDSEILFLANRKDEIDLDTVDRLAFSNKDFREFLKNVEEDIKLGKVKSEYDKWD
ncbi:HTH domain-containing protein [Leptospira venezuelensis]|uniref:HTH domain-containing protein n=1 Tax=Leptospira venezuelensis TaxID=1958811 RepID=UPI000A39A5A0|nr:HTH domain-containing protein [Leptospira venezuelensis]